MFYKLGVSPSRQYYPDGENRYFNTLAEYFEFLAKNGIVHLITPQIILIS